LVAVIAGIRARYGPSFNGLAAGLIVDCCGYDAAFAASAGVALLALLVLGHALPETGRRGAARAGVRAMDRGSNVGAWARLTSG
jgi:hypothetical protein